MSGLIVSVKAYFEQRNFLAAVFHLNFERYVLTLFLINTRARLYFKYIWYIPILNIELLKVIKTCAYHSEMKYCPVLLQIMHEDLRKIYGGDEWNYLLQVYNDQGVCVFDKVLKCKHQHIKLL